MSNFRPKGKIKDTLVDYAKEKFGDPEAIIKQKIKEHYNSRFPQRPSNYDPYKPRPINDNPWYQGEYNPSFEQSQAINNLRKQQQHFKNLNKDMISRKLSKKEN